MNQTRLESLVEVLLNTAVGFTVSYSVGPLMYIYLDIPYSGTSNFVITTAFTVISIIRSYVIRRWFNAGLHNLAKTISRNLIQWRNR